MLEALILSAVIALPQDNTLTQLEVPPADYVHVCVIPSTPLMFVLASDHPIEVDDAGNYVIRDGVNPEGDIIENLTLRGSDWNCSSTKFGVNGFDRFLPD